MYRIWVGNRVIISRDVKFHENESFEEAEIKKASQEVFSRKFEIGEEVLCDFSVGKRKKEIKSYKGVVQDINEENKEYHVIFEDGEEILNVKENELTKFSVANVEAKPSQAVNVETKSCQANNVDIEPISEPINWEEMMKSDQKEKWLEAVNKEMESLKQMNTWKEVDRPKDKPVIKNKWVFKIKYNSIGLIDKYKARLVAKELFIDKFKFEGEDNICRSTIVF